MKKLRLFLLTLVAALGGSISASAEAYTVDFNTSITTSDHAFQVASNWRHIVDTYEDYWGDASYPSYSYSETAGVDGSGALSCITNQSNYSIYDLLVTPVVKGTVTIAAKTTATYYTPQLSFYKITDNGDGTYTRGAQITVDVSAVNASSYTTITIPVDEAGERIGIRSSYVWLDNFTATEATIVPELKMTIATAVPSATTGTIYWEQQPNGKVLVSYTVTVTNTGDVALTQGTENYSVSIINRSTGDVYATVDVPQDLARGETSDKFVVSAEVEPSLWPSSYTYINMDLKENLFGSTVQRAQSSYTAYEPKFVFRAGGSTSTSSISSAESWGTITESTTKSFEIANTGTAPLTVKSVTLPEGFTSDNAPTAEFTVAKGEKQTLNITLDAATMGTFSGNLVIVYLDKDGAEQNYTLTFSATVIGANTWTADFNNSTSTVAYPEGSVAESGINKDYQYISSGNYNNWLIGRNDNSYKTANNKFITPKLHANAGDQLAFDVKAGYSSSDEYFVKVYVSTDRQNWGEPVENYFYSTVGSSFVTKTVTFDAAGDYYVAFALYGNGSGLDNLVGLEKVDVAHDLYIKSVSWPDASVKSGTALSKPSVEIIPLTTETADAYTVKYIYGDNVVEIASKALTASASSTTSFAASFTPEVTATTTFPGTKVVFEFTDGTKFETETFDLTVTNEPIFHFQNTKYTSRWYEPSSDYSTPYNFGKTNTSGASKTFWILNWGSAPLTVKSITVPEGFTTSVSSMSLPAFDGTQDGLETCQQSFDVTFTATEAGTYSGNLVVTYINAAGEDATYELPISGTMLDPTLWYANFGSDQNQWPAGSVYQKNVSTTYVATGDYAISSSSATDNVFVTPKLVSKGEAILFDAKLYSSSWSEGAVKVYVADTREEVINAEEGTTRQLIYYASGEATDADATITTDYQTFTVNVPAGEWYLGFEISGRPYVDELYGLKLANVKHDWALVSSTIPTEAMQNTTVNASVNIANFGVKAEAAGSYTVTVYVDEEPVATPQPETALPTVNKLDDAGTKIDVPFKYGVEGTFPVYIEVEADGYKVKTEAVDVTFAKEEGKSDAEMATNGTTSEVPLYLNYKNSESVTLYNADALASAGLSAGAKIKAITYKGYKTTDEQTTSFQVYYKWTDDQTLAQPATTYPYAAADNGMTKLIDEDHTWTKVGSSSELGDMIVLDFSSDPLVYEEGKSLCIYMHSYVDGYKTAYFAKSTLSSDYCYTRKADAATLSSSWSKAVPAAIQFSLEASAATLTGSVTYDSSDLPAEGATVTLVSEDDDKVQYTGTTDDEGKFSIEVIQATRTYTVTASKDGAERTAESVSDFSQPVDLKLKDLPELTIGDEALTGEVPAVANVTIARSLRKGWNAIVFPFTLTADEVKTAFGEGNYELVTYDSDEGTDEVTVKFKSATKIVAGTPYLLYLESMPASGDLRFLNKEITDETRTVTGQVFDFVGTFDGATTADGDYFIQGGKLVKTSNGATVKPFRSYLKLKNTAAGARGIRFVINGVEEDTTTTAIEDAIVAPVQVEGVYNLQGQKVEQLKKGQLYIINGKKVLVK